MTPLPLCALALDEAERRERQQELHVLLNDIPPPCSVSSPLLFTPSPSTLGNEELSSCTTDTYSSPSATQLTCQDNCSPTSAASRAPLNSLTLSIRPSSDPLYLQTRVSELIVSLRSCEFQRKGWETQSHALRNENARITEQLQVSTSKEQQLEELLLLLQGKINDPLVSFTREDLNNTSGNLMILRGQLLQAARMDAEQSKKAMYAWKKKFEAINQELGKLKLSFECQSQAYEEELERLNTHLAQRAVLCSAHERERFDRDKEKVDKIAEIDGLVAVNELLKSQLDKMEKERVEDAAARQGLEAKLQEEGLVRQRLQEHFSALEKELGDSTNRIRFLVCEIDSLKKHSNLSNVEARYTGEIENLYREFDKEREGWLTAEKALGTDLEDMKKHCKKLEQELRILRDTASVGGRKGGPVGGEDGEEALRHDIRNLEEEYLKREKALLDKLDEVGKEVGRLKEGGKNERMPWEDSELEEELDLLRGLLKEKNGEIEKLTARIAEDEEEGRVALDKEIMILKEELERLRISASMREKLEEALKGRDLKIDDLSGLLEEEQCDNERLKAVIKAKEDAVELHRQELESLRGTFDQREEVIRCLNVEIEYLKDKGDPRIDEEEMGQLRKALIKKDEENGKLQQDLEALKQILIEKESKLSSIMKEMDKVKNEGKNEMEGLRTAVKEEVQKTDAKLKAEVQELSQKLGKEKRKNEEMGKQFHEQLKRLLVEARESFTREKDEEVENAKKARTWEIEALREKDRVWRKREQEWQEENLALEGKIGEIKAELTQERVKARGVEDALERATLEGMDQMEKLQKEGEKERKRLWDEILKAKEDAKKAKAEWEDERKILMEQIEKAQEDVCKARIDEEAEKGHWMRQAESEWRGRFEELASKTSLVQEALEKLGQKASEQEVIISMLKHELKQNEESSLEKNRDWEEKYRKVTEKLEGFRKRGEHSVEREWKDRCLEMEKELRDSKLRGEQGEDARIQSFYDELIIRDAAKRASDETHKRRLEEIVKRLKREFDREIEVVMTTMQEQYSYKIRKMEGRWAKEKRALLLEFGGLENKCGEVDCYSPLYRKKGGENDIKRFFKGSRHALFEY